MAVSRWPERKRKSERSREKAAKGESKRDDNTHSDKRSSTAAAAAAAAAGVERGTAREREDDADEAGVKLVLLSCAALTSLARRSFLSCSLVACLCSSLPLSPSCFARSLRSTRALVVGGREGDGHSYQTRLPHSSPASSLSLSASLAPLRLLASRIRSSCRCHRSTYAKSPASRVATRERERERKIKQCRYARHENRREKERRRRRLRRLRHLLLRSSEGDC